MNIEQFLLEKQKENLDISRPLVLNLAAESGRVLLEYLTKDGKIARVSDDFEEQMREYFAVEHPELIFHPEFKKYFEDYWQGLLHEKPRWQHGVWVYFPWMLSLIHVLDEEAFNCVRTARNKHLITEAEQKKFYESTIGIAGLSVGNSVALSIVLGGGAKRIKLADFDRLSLSNLNRIRGGVECLGFLKVEMTARQIYSLNPFTEVEYFPGGLNEENMDRFFDGLDLVVDEIDNLGIKYRIRQEAKKRKLPVVMAADNGDNGVVDIDRYDLDPELEFFHGRMGDLKYEDLIRLNKMEIGKLITRLVGPENVTERMQQSLMEIGKTVVSWPQLGGAALLNGSAVAYCVRRILNHQSVFDNRTLISWDELMDPEHNTDLQKKHRAELTLEFKKKFGL
ncbi:MAG: Uncharacterized protein G01um101418_180 [Parcubacteria group bacterium Gr01-1014_18]|nr:MAG: Uncharacterized protein Greene041636_148 [Parcubacteria group bacterium Greene0416_36]TSC81340.1 MAG: Uncharacterized protein G01um101418_180 [Parcubacteria group bacterium Gr01-1014_18]TSC99474.1 MAG: Uncharacterized protein Greene101420_141 [Parcubacteria group bacterium Greene1014_20]TSD07607.1 MAG: Uncharacterized protein Greene07142_64 [Parcubacteria group bacterium Greene0714_2]